MKHRAFFAAIILPAALVGRVTGLSAGVESSRPTGRAIVAATGLRAGLCVQVGCGEGHLTAELAGAGDFLVHALALDAAAVVKARAYLRTRGLYGRAVVEQLSIGELAYNENTVNLLVSAELSRAGSAGLSVREVLRALVPGGAAFLVFRQPNLSTATLYMACWIAMLFVSGVGLGYFAGTGAVVLAVLPVVWSHLDTYMRDRIANFLDPARDPGAYYNVQQALISIGSGGLFGKGFATGTQSQLHFLRVRHTDFIFSVICEELGFVGAVLILGVFALLLWRMLRIAANAEDLTGRLIVTGVIAFIFYPLLVNLGMNLNVLPVAGLPMPFISSGGSALVVTYIGLGLVQSVAMRQGRLEF